MSAGGLRRSISTAQFFALSFGCIVGVAWVMVLGDLIARAGPGGTVAALLLGGGLILLVGLCYAEMAALRPAADGEMAYARELFGEPAAFAVGWTLALIYVAVCAFEAISLGAVAGLLFPGIEGAVVYRILGADVTAGGLAIGLAGTVALAVVNLLGVHATARAQEWLTYVRILLILGFLGVALRYAEPANLRPLFEAADGPLGTVGFLGALAAAPFFYSGFSVFASATEEAAAPLRRVGHAILFGIAGAALFYCALVLVISAMLPWREVVKLDLAPATVFAAVTGNPLVTKLVLAVAFIGNLTAWNAILLAGARVLFALARAGHVAPALGRLHPARGTPAAAILFITAVSVAGLLLGRGFIMPIVNITSAGFAFLYVVTCAAVVRLRRTQPGGREFAVPGGNATARVALAGSGIIMAVALVQPALAAGRVPVEWFVIGGWALVGLAAWSLRPGLPRVAAGGRQV